MASYPQNWKAYDIAKTTEDQVFRKLLIELISTIKVELKPGVGRKGYSKAEKIFFLATKQYYKSDLRKTTSILRTMVEYNVIPQAPSYSSICNFYNEEAITTLLEDLIFLAALPVASIETTVAIDSTGFGTRKFQNWNEYKWGKLQGKEHLWRKLHATVGCTTNVFLTTYITENNSNDAGAFPKTISPKLTAFDFNQFVADKAYSARTILGAIKELGMTPFIPFRSNARRINRGSGSNGTWKTAFDMYHNDREEFDKQYHQRSNIETAFHMLKIRFGEKLSSRNFIANKNEMLTKILCHNLCVLAQESQERAITPDFTSCSEIARACSVIK